MRALFVNGGILGLRTFASFVERELVGDRDGVHAEQIVLAGALTLGERVRRRVLCARVWPAGDGGVRNLDFQRFRAEWHAGLLARSRIRQRERAAGRFDVLHFHCQSAAYGSLGRLRSSPSIVSMDCTQRCVLESARARLEKWTYAPNVRRDGQIFRATRLIVAASRWAEASLREEYPDCTTEIAVRPNPVELAWFDPRWIEQRYRRAVDTPHSPVRVLFIGGDFPRKGGYDLLDAWQRGRFADRARLDIVTSWPIEPRRLGAGVQMHAGISSHSPAWQALWLEADIFVLPTRDEAFGIVFQEAAAAGLPAIGTRINAVPELVHDETTGRLAEVGNTAQLALALDDLIESPERRREMGRRARELVEQSADPDAYRQFLTDAILRLGRE